MGPLHGAKGRSIGRGGSLRAREARGATGSGPCPPWVPRVRWPRVGDVVGHAGERLTPGAAELTGWGDAGKAVVHDLGHYIAGGGDVGGQVLLATGTGDVSKFGSERGRSTVPARARPGGRGSRARSSLGPVDRRRRRPSLDQPRRNG
jgi:hypothetical protein